ncbi:oligosaccharide flippase family protein [Chloroflexota bacterium]
MESSYRKSGADTIAIGVGTLVVFLVGLIQLPLLTKMLGAHAYGIWAQVQATIGLIMPFAGLGLVIAMVRFLAAEKEREGIQEGFYSVVAVLALVGMLVSLGLIIFARPLAMNFFDGAVQIVRIAGVIVFFDSVIPAYLNLIRTFQQIRRYSVFMAGEACLRVAVFAGLVLSGHDILSVILAMLAIKVIFLSVLFFLIKSQIGIRKPHFSRIREYFSFGLPTVPRSIGYWLVYLSDRYVISFFLGVTPVGVYSAAYGIGYLPCTIMTVLTFVLLATLSQLYDEGRLDEVRTHLSYSLKYYLAIVIPFFFGAVIMGKPVLRLFTTPEIASGGYHIIPIVALGFLLYGAHNVISHILILVKKTKVMLWTWLAAAALNLGLNVWLVPLIGIIGAAITSLVAFILALGIVSYYSFKEFKFSINWHFIIKSLIASTVMSLAVWLMAPQGNVDTILVVVAGVIIYGAVLLLLKGFDREEIRFFWGLFRKRALR